MRLFDDDDEGADGAGADFARAFAFAQVTTATFGSFRGAFRGAFGGAGSAFAFA